MKLDFSTVLLACTVLSIAMGAALLQFQHGYPRLWRGVTPIAWASISLGLASAFLGARTLGPQWATPSVLLGNALITVTQVLLHIGMCRLMDRRNRLPWVLAVTLASFLGGAWYALVVPEPAARALLFSVGAFVVLGLTLWELLRARRLRRMRGLDILILAFAAVMLMLLARCALILFNRDRAESYFVDAPVQPLMMLVITLAFVIVVLTVMAIVSERALQRFKETARYEDPVTGLPNRTAAMRRLDGALLRAARRSEPTSVVLVEIDNFRQFNDWYGHDMGDDVLRHLRDCLQDCVGLHDTVARWGGKHFIVVLPEAGPESAAACAGAIVATVGDRPLIAGTLSIEVSVCAASATSRASRASRDAVLIEAESALAEACRSHTGTAPPGLLD